MHIFLLLSIPFDPTVEVDGSNLGASSRGQFKRLSRIPGMNFLVLHFIEDVLSKLSPYTSYVNDFCAVGR
jgi:hypothetical protein